MRLGKREKDILQWILILGHVKRVDLYESMWLKEAKIIKNSLFEWDHFNKIKVLLSQSLTTLKKKKLITERSRRIFLTGIGRIKIQSLIREELRFKENKKR